MLFPSLFPFFLTDILVHDPLDIIDLSLCLMQLLIASAVGARHHEEGRREGRERDERNRRKDGRRTKRGGGYELVKGNDDRES